MTEGGSHGTGEGGSIDYPALMRQALLGLVRSVLERAAAEGLPGDHHFYLTFGTNEEGVALPPRLRKQFPDEMTIVLQHQFWNLTVEDGGFQVTLRFGGAPQRLSVPWTALRAFADPSVGLGLRLQVAAGHQASRETGDQPPRAAAEPPAGPPAPRAGGRADSNIVELGAFRRRPPGEPHE